MSSDPWWLAFTPAQATIPCAGATHRLRWEAGVLSALDHEDAEAERALAALGGERCACVDVLDAWARHAGDERVLLLASRGVGDTLARERPTSPRLLVGMRPAGVGAAMVTAAGWANQARAVPPRAVPATRGHAPAGADAELVSLLELGGGIPERLVATVAEAWRTRLERPDTDTTRAHAALQAALYGRAAAALGSWLGDSDLEVEVTMVEAGEPRALRHEDRGIHAELPFGWLAEVSCRGLATVWGRFCLAASSADGYRWTLTTVGPDLGEHQPLTIELAPEAV